MLRGADVADWAGECVIEGEGEGEGEERCYAVV